MKIKQKGLYSLLLVGSVVISLTIFFLPKRIYFGQKSNQSVSVKREYDSTSLVTESVTNQYFLEKQSKKNQGKGVKDIDGNFYKTVIIGEQEWLAQNLKVTKKYNDGTEIPLVTDNSKWASNKEERLETPMMCYFANSLINKKIWSIV